MSVLSGKNFEVVDISQGKIPELHKVSLKVETRSVSLCARKNHSCLQCAAGGQECRVHRVWPPAVKAASDTAKAAADAK